MRIEDFPYTILVLAPVGIMPEVAGEPQILPVDLTTLDDAMAAINPVIRIEAPKELCPDAWMTISLTRFKDLNPEGLVATCDYLAKLHGAISFVDQAKDAGKGMQAIASELQEKFPGLPLSMDFVSAPQDAPQSTDSQVDDILSMVAMPEAKTATSSAGVNDVKAQLDSLLASLLQIIFNDPQFRHIEAAWRGLRTMLKQGGVREGDRVRVFLSPIGTRSMEATLDALVPKLMDTLPQLVLVDLGFDATPLGIERIKKVAEFGDALLAPTAIQAWPNFFQLDSWHDLGKIPYISNFLEDMAYAKWRNLRKEPNANWLIMMCNSFLARSPYGVENKPRTPFFKEKFPLWLSPVWALGTLVAQSVHEHGWPSRFTDYMTVALNDLPVLDTPNSAPMSTEFPVSEDRLQEFIEAGITPLMGALHKDIAILPKETTVAGSSIRAQLFLNEVLGFFFWCKENMAAELETNLEVNLTRTLSLFWQLTGQEAPSDTHIEIKGELEGGGTQLLVQFTPPRAVLPGAQRVEFGFIW